MTDIITGPGSYRTVDGRRVEVERSGDYWIAKNLNCIRRNSDERSNILAQIYVDDGRVQSMRSGEENDRIVARWPDDPKVGETWCGRASDETFKIEAVAAGHVIISKEPNYSNSMDMHSFHVSYQPAPRFIDGWVNLWHDGENVYSDKKPFSTKATAEEYARIKGGRSGDKHLATVEVESVPT